MAGQRKKAGFRCIRDFSIGFGFHEFLFGLLAFFDLSAQGLVDALDLARALLHAVFEVEVGFFEFVLRIDEIADVIIGGHVTAVGQRASLDFDHAVVVRAHHTVGFAGHEMAQPGLHVFFHGARTEHAALGIEAHEVGDRPSYAQHARRVIEHLLVALVPGHDFQIRVDYADRRRNAFEGCKQHILVELQLARGAFENVHHVLDTKPFTTAQVGQHRTRGCDTNHAGQRLLGITEQFGAGIDQLRPGFGVQQAVRGRFTQELGQQRGQVRLFDLQVGRARRLLGAHAVDESDGLDAVGQAGLVQGRHHVQREHVDADAEHHAAGVGVAERQAEQLVRAQQLRIEKPVRDQRRADQSRIGEQRNHQRDEPYEGAAGEAGEHAPGIGALPEQTEQDGRRKLHGQRERDQPDIGQRRILGQAELIHPGHEHDHDHGHAPREDKRPGIIRLRAAAFVPANQQRQDHIVAEHLAQRDRGDDDHRGGRGKAADDREQRECLVIVTQRQREHETVAGNIRARERLVADPGDYEHGGRDRGKVEREPDACVLEVIFAEAFDEGDLEHARQAENGGCGDQGQHPERGCQCRLLEHEVRVVVDLARVKAGRQTQREQRDHDQRDDLDQRLERDRDHDAGVITGHIEAVGAENQRKHDHRDRDQQGHVLAGEGDVVHAVEQRV